MPPRIAATAIIRGSSAKTRTYLRAWADSDELLAFRRRGDNARPASVKSVAVKGGLYGLGELGAANEKMY
jgi:hypothetical protein